jgi:hypothetical protein
MKKPRNNLLPGFPPVRYENPGAYIPIVLLNRKEKRGPTLLKIMKVFLTSCKSLKTTAIFPTFLWGKTLS